VKDAREMYSASAMIAAEMDNDDGDDTQPNVTKSVPKPAKHTVGQSNTDKSNERLTVGAKKANVVRVSFASLAGLLFLDY
jgi:hypothetical protein